MFTVKMWRFEAIKDSFGTMSILRSAGIFAVTFMVVAISALATAQAKKVVTAPFIEKGTIVVNTKSRQLFYGLGDGKAIKYTVAVGRAGKQWKGTTYIRSKRWKPAWKPTPEIRRDNPRLPAVIPGGSPRNPVGVAALVLARDKYAIHGTNRPESIGKSVSYGCIRMHNKDITDLYKRVRWGRKVKVIVQ
jgi:lipoprotein-anchoring transpeptidase ErfK/SrfK